MERHQLHDLSNALLDNETIDSEEFIEILTSGYGSPSNKKIDTIPSEEQKNSHIQED